MTQEMALEAFELTTQLQAYLKLQKELSTDLKHVEVQLVKPLEALPGHVYSVNFPKCMHGKILDAVIGVVKKQVKEIEYKIKELQY